MLGKFKLSKSGIIILISCAVVIAAMVASAYFYTRYQKALNQLNNPQAAGQEELANTIRKISRFMDLPEGEAPTLATVTDISKLSEQPFFAKAKNGDKVLIFNTAKKAILYDPIRNKIIEVAPLNVSSPSAQTATTAAAVTVALYNGTNAIGLTGTLEQLLRTKGESPTVVLRDNAKKRDYEKTLIIDLTGNKSAEAKRVAQAINGQVSTLPEGETAPVLPTGQSAELMIIAGKDLVTTPTAIITAALTPSPSPSPSTASASPSPAPTQ